MTRWPTILVVSALVTLVFGFGGAPAGTSEVVWTSLLFFTLMLAFALMWRPVEEKPPSR